MGDTGLVCGVVRADSSMGHTESPGLVQSDEGCGDNDIHGQSAYKILAREEHSWLRGSKEGDRILLEMHPPFLP